MTLQKAMSMPNLAIVDASHRLVRVTANVRQLVTYYHARRTDESKAKTHYGEGH